MKIKAAASILAAGIALCIAFPGALLGRSPDAASVERLVRGTHGMAKAGNNRAPFNMVSVPKGDVILGMDQELVEKLAEGNRTILAVLSASIPKHQERGIDEFYCDKTEVTNAQWKAYLDATGRKPSELLKQFAWSAGPDGGMSYPEGEGNLPIRNVDIYEAREFARWCGKRLPTEAEWMRAAAADQGFLYAWGNEWDPKYSATRDRRTRSEVLAPVGSHTDAASPFGILDMTGSVWEWTESPFVAYPHFQALSMMAGKKKETVEPGFDALQYLIKGGYYIANSVTNLLPVRQPALPNTNLDTLGFRCVKSTKPGEDVFEAAKSMLASAYFKDVTWDNENRYVIEIEQADTEQKILVECDHFLFAPVKKLLTSINKITKNESSFPDGLLPLGILSVTEPIEEPSLPAGAYTLVYRHRGHGGGVPAEVSTGTEEEPASEGEEGAEDGEPPVEEEPQEEQPAAEPEQEEQPASGEAGGLPENKNLVLFIDRTGGVAAYVAIEHFKESDEGELARIVHVPTSGVTELEFTIPVLGSRHPRFTLPIKVRNNPFQN